MHKVIIIITIMICIMIIDISLLLHSPSYVRIIIMLILLYTSLLESIQTLLANSVNIIELHILE